MVSISYSQNTRRGCEEFRKLFSAHPENYGLIFEFTEDHIEFITI